MASIRKYLYRKAGWAVTLAMAVAGLALAAQGQFRAAPAERKTPRAVGVVEVFKNGTRRLIPVSFFYEKKYYDAAQYKAAPVPLTLYSETVYEVQRYGRAMGTFTVQTAGHHELAWWGNGKFKPLAEPSVLAKKKRPAKIVVEDPSKPTLHRREGSEGDVDRTAAAPAKAPADDDPSRPKLKRREDSGTAAKTTQDDPDRPKLKRKEGSEGDATAKNDAGAAAAPAAAPSAPDDPDRPRLKRPGGTSAPAEAPATTSAAAKPVALTPDGNPDRPILRRGKPVVAQGGADLEEYKPEEAVERLVAVSDAGRSGEPRSLIYTCPPEERARLERQARVLALAELQRLGAMRGLPRTAAAPAPPAARKKGARTAKTPPAAPEWKPEDEQFVPYDLDWNNYATVVYSARYTPPQTDLSVGGRPRSWVVLVVARQEETKLVKLYSAVSDPRELDLYPEMRLVDAVDPEGYERNAFLFREKKRDGVTWLLGRPTGYELIELFETAVR